MIYKMFQYSLILVILALTVIGIITIVYTVREYRNQRNVLKSTKELIHTWANPDMRATPQDYQRVFEIDASGRRVLMQLVKKYMQEPFDVDDRKTAYRCGAREPVAFIIEQIQRGRNQ
ncbi:sigma factor regulator [Escherichia phage vB_EcoM_APEC]|nr:sigma factor regulator [Escherichia phage vB_EcoM_APEC]